MNGQRFCLWSGLAFLTLFGLGFVVFAGFLPPPSPMLTADQIAAMFRERTTMIRVGVIFMLFAAGFMLPWTALISSQMRRIRGCGPGLVDTQLISGCAVMVFLTLPALLWGLATFRPERDAALLLLINDFAWLSVVMPLPPAVLQTVAIGLAILGDRDALPVFPRWAAYFNLWVAFLFIPACGALFFKTGVFAWSGLLPFWIPLVVLGAWYVVMFALLRSALRREAQSAPLM